MVDEDGRGSAAEERLAARARLLGVLRTRAEALSAPEEGTVGTGSAFAIGCTVVMLLICLIGIAIIVATRW
jgi:hypothetical protein